MRAPDGRRVPALVSYIHTGGGGVNNGITGSSQDVVEGPVIEQPDKVLSLLYRQYLKAKISYDGAHRIERYPFPKAAVREAVVNAVAHKDYASGSPVQIRVYDDRLLIGNTCILPQGWTIKDLLGFHTSEPHNPKLANVFFLAGLVESWGRGVQKILTECKLDGIDEPTYRVSGGSLHVEFTAPEDRVVRTGGRLSGNVETFVTASSLSYVGNHVGNVVNVGNDVGDHLTKTGPLTATERAIIAEMKADPKAAAKDIASAIGISERQVERVRKALREAGLIERIGGTRGHWKIMDE